MKVRTAAAFCGVIVSSAAMADVVYTSTTETGSRYNPGPATGGVAQRIVFDDVKIPDAILGGGNALEVTKVTFGIRRAGSAAAVDVDFYWGTVTPASDPVALDPAIHLFSEVTLAQLANPGFTTELVVIGDGTSTLFTAPLDTNAYAGFGTFFLGMQFSDPSADNAWRITSGPDNNEPVFWNYNPDDMTTGRFVFSSGAPGTFYMIVEGNVVPAPGAAAMLGLAGVAFTRRRR